MNRFRPMLTTMRPDRKLSQGYSCSGRMYWEAKRVTNPRANTPVVWVIVVVSPKNTACWAVARDPAR